MCVGGSFAVVTWVFFIDDGYWQRIRDGGAVGAPCGGRRNVGGRPTNRMNTGNFVAAPQNEGVFRWSLRIVVIDSKYWYKVECDSFNFPLRLSCHEGT